MSFGSAYTLRFTGFVIGKYAERTRKRTMAKNSLGTHTIIKVQYTIHNCTMLELHYA